MTKSITFLLWKKALFFFLFFFFIKWDLSLLYSSCVVFDSLPVVKQMCTMPSMLVNKPVIPGRTDICDMMYQTQFGVKIAWKNSSYYKYSLPASTISIVNPMRFLFNLWLFLQILSLLSEDNTGIFCSENKMTFESWALPFIYKEHTLISLSLSVWTDNHF